MARQPGLDPATGFRNRQGPSRAFLHALTLCAVALALAPAPTRAAGDPPPVRVGYAISRTGPFAAGAQVSQEPNYLLWAEQVNAAGGLDVKGQRRKVELVGSDDASDVDTAVRMYLKLMTEEKVDLILPPWGTGTNFAVAPLATRYGYPLLSPTALSRKLIDLKLPYFFSFLQQPDRMMGALVDLLAAKGIKTAAVVYVDDLFGLENFRTLMPLLEKKGIRVVEERSYPLGVQDLSPVLKSIKAKSPDAFLGITYPPDTFLVTKQSRDVGFNPKVFYTSVGTSFAVFRDQMGASAEDVLGMGSWNAGMSGQARSYFDAHVARFHKEPDRWASGASWATLQVLQEAIKAVGLDRKAIRDYVASHEFQTVVGPIRFEGSENVATPGIVSQWQKGEFHVVWPPQRATAQLVFPKPAWK